jgi:RNA polymerase sigma-70 factor (ECF subfamily)
MFFVKHPEKFDSSRGTLFSFLCGVARNKVFNHFKKTGTRLEMIDIETKDFENSTNGSGKSPLKILLDREFAAKVEECVAKLSPFQREVMILREIEDFSYEEIAGITETEIGVVKSRLYRARHALARQLAPYLKNEEEMIYEVH